MRQLLFDLKLRLYKILVQKNPYVKDKYEEYVKYNLEEHQEKPWKSWFLLIKLNLLYRLLKKTIENDIYVEEKKLCIKNSESFQYRRTDIDDLVKQLKEYDIISFDIFDTLIFRPFCEPTDLFYIVGEKLKYLNFTQIRKKWESKARSDKNISHKTYEVNIFEIYDLLEKNAGVDKEEGIHTEFQVEYNLCYANPYMQKVFHKLQELGKTIVIVSDMYWPKEYLEKILKKNGFNNYAELFVSCDYGVSKHSGELYRVVKEKYGKDKSYIHIGDNLHSDIERASEKGYKTIYYSNVSKFTPLYRAEDMSHIVGSAYRGVVNAKLHNGLDIYSPQYEYGYVYGGLFILGYCNYIRKYVKNNEIEKVLFLARDGEIIKKVYDKLYPEENTEYVYWSRLAAIKLTANHNKEDFFQRFIWHKIDTGIKVGDVLKAMDLSKIADQINIDLECVLTKQVGKRLEKELLGVWDAILLQYSEENETAREYYTAILKGTKKVCAVDIGWAGSGAMALDYLVSREWKLETQIIGIVAGTNTRNNIEADASEAFLQSGRLVSYMYSQHQNRDVWKYHNPALDHNIYFEMLVGSVTQSLHGFQKDESGMNDIFVFAAKEEGNEYAINQIHKGIIDFVDDYIKAFRNYEYMLDISGRDAYAPFMLATGNNSEYLKYVLSGCKFTPFVGGEGIDFVL